MTPKTKKRKPPGVNPWGEGEQHPQLCAEEKDILKRLRAGSSLAVSRHIVGRREGHLQYGLLFYWEEYPSYPDISDRAVILLLARQLVRVVTCAGGATWIRLAGR